MAIICPSCRQANEDGLEICLTCAALLRSRPTEEWWLVPKERGQLLEDRAVLLRDSPLVVGRSHSSTGPADVDLSSMPGGRTASRRHAVLKWAGGGWTVRDLGSANGVFIRRGGEGRFSARLTDPAVVVDGDEIAMGSTVLVVRMVAKQAPEAKAAPPARVGAPNLSHQDIAELSGESADWPYIF